MVFKQNCLFYCRTQTPVGLSLRFGSEPLTADDYPEGVWELYQKQSIELVDSNIGDYDTDETNLAKPEVLTIIVCPVITV